MKSHKTLLLSLGGIIIFFLFLGGIFFLIFPSFEEKQDVNILEKQTVLDFNRAEKQEKNNSLPGDISQKNNNHQNSKNPEDEKILAVELPVLPETENCEKKEAGFAKQTCEDALFLEASSYNNDPSGCAHIKNIQTKEYCQDSITLKKIIQDKNFENCETLATVILSKKCLDAKSIDKVNTAKQKSDCTELSAPYKTECIRKFLTVNDFHFSPSKCDAIPKDDSDDRKFCQRMAMEYTIKHLNPLDCSQYPSLESFCLSQKALYSDKKFFKQSISEKNIHFCSKIVSVTTKTKCKDSLLPTLAWEKKDLSFCELISTQKGQEKCLIAKSKEISQMFYRQALQKNEREICKKIPDIVKRTACEEVFE